MFAEPLPGHKIWCLCAEARKQRSRESLGGKTSCKQDYSQCHLCGFDALLDFFLFLMKES